MTQGEFATTVITRYLIVMLAGACGASLRYGLGLFINRLNSAATFPWPTLTVNLTGSFIIGLAWAIFDKVLNASDVAPHADHWRLFIMVGFLGAFTTFSTFSLENIALFRQGSIRIAIINILVSNIGGLALAWLGIILGKYLVK